MNANGTSSCPRIKVPGAGHIWQHGVCIFCKKPKPLQPKNDQVTHASGLYPSVTKPK